MEKNNVEIIKIKGVTYEIVNSAARRYGVSAQVIQDHLGKELFRAKDPRTGVLMICGALPEGVEREFGTGEKVRLTLGTMVEFLFACPTDGIMPNVLWTSVWCGVGCLVGYLTEVWIGILVGLLAGMLRLCFAVKYDLEHPKKKTDTGSRMSFADMDALYFGGGGGFFDEVSTRRRSDLQFLLGTGPFAR